MSREYSFRGKAITVQEPWASAIAYAGKNIENRSVRTYYRGPIAIHAAADASIQWHALDYYVRVERAGEQRFLRDWIRKGRKKSSAPQPEGEPIAPGCVVAIAMLVDCIERSGSPWFCGPFGYVLEGIIPIHSIAKKGKLGLWNVQFKYEPV